MVLEHLREYFETTDDPSLEEVRRVQIEFEAVQDGDRRTVIAHLLTDEEPIDRLTFQISREEDPQLFDAVDEKNLYFLQGIDEKTILYSVEHQLKRVLASDEHDALQKMLHAYAHRRLTGYSRQECMRVALQYSFHDLLDELDSNDFQTITDTEQQDQYIRMMIKEVQTRFHSSVERRRVRADREIGMQFIGFV